MGGIFTIWRHNLCAVSGAIAGAFAGTFFGLFLIEAAFPAMTPSDRIIMGLALAFVAWLFLLLVLASWLKYALGAIWLPALANAVITAVLTVFATYALKHFPYLGPSCGLIIGTVIGAILCRFCEPRRLAVQK